MHGGEERGTGLRGRRAHAHLTSRSHSRCAESNDTLPYRARVSEWGPVYPYNVAYL
jgi:hypothetical protein